MSENNKTIVKRFIEEYQAQNDLNVLYEIVSPDLVNRTPMFPNAPGGPVEVKTIFDMFRAAFDDFGVEIIDQLAEGDKVVTYKAFSGVHHGDFMGIAPTGSPVRFTVIDIVRLRGGQIVEHWGLVDQLGLLQQLGVPAIR
ncbi:MAG TPA: ester cyclase [Nakamurella sp.]